MKKALIIVITFLLVVTSALFIYGLTQGTQKDLDNTAEAMLMPPDKTLTFIGGDTNSVDIAAIYADTSISQSEKAAKMIVNASYNNIFIEQFYYQAHVDVRSGSKASYSDYYRAKTGANMFYQTFAYTGTLNPAQIKIDYVDQRVMKQTTTRYDAKTKTWSASFSKPSVDPDNEGKVVTLQEPTPYNIYSWYDFPLDLGGISAANDDTTGRTEAIDYSLIDPSSVQIELVNTDPENPYYRITFKADIAKAQASRETLDRFSESFSSLDDIKFRELDFTVEIWKDLGVFRQINYYARVVASVSGSRGEAKIDKKIGFSYDDEDASVAAHIKALDEQFGGWIKKLSRKNQDILKEDLAALEQRIAAKKAAEEAAEEAAEGTSTEE